MSAAQSQLGWRPSKTVEKEKMGCRPLTRCSGPRTRRCRHIAAKKGSRRRAAQHPSLVAQEGGTPPAPPTTVTPPTPIVLPSECRTLRARSESGGPRG
eukprot:1708550-Pyramimonas_sp.AAC.1